MIRAIVSWFFILFCLPAFSGVFDVCALQAVREDHRLERMEAIQNCFVKNRSQLTISSCYKAVDKLKLGNISLELSDKIKTLCFYEVSQFKSLSSCMNSTQLFHSAAEKDEAIFECYRQFQNQLTPDQCLYMTKQIKYPLKREHLVSQCYSP